MEATNVIQLSDYIPRKPVARGGQQYRCTDCHKEWLAMCRLDEAIYCGCGAEMRPVEG